MTYIIEFNKLCNDTNFILNINITNLILKLLDYIYKFQKIVFPKLYTLFILMHIIIYIY